MSLTALKGSVAPSRCDIRKKRWGNRSQSGFNCRWMEQGVPRALLWVRLSVRFERSRFGRPSGEPRRSTNRGGLRRVCES